MDNRKAASSEDGAGQAGQLRRKAGVLLALPWPILYFGYWSLYHVKGPAADGFGAGMYAAGVFSTSFGLLLYILNRAVVYANQIADPGRGDRFLRIVARVLFVAGVLGLLPTLFFFFVGFPFSLVGIILTLFALFRWTFFADGSDRGGNRT